MRFWFTSDLHLGHAKIIEYCNRPFKSVYHMNKELIRRWNERVSQEDIVFHIGDFCFKGGKEGGSSKALEWEKQLNGKIIHIQGNHDRNNSCKTIIQGLLIETHGKKVYIVHNPEHYNDRYNINLVGHVHDKWRIKGIPHTGFLINMSVDVWNFMPVSFDEIMKRYNKFIKENR